MSIPTRLLSYLLLVLIVGHPLVLTSCSSTPDKRVLQYLNTEGFGKRYTGNAEEQNYVTLLDSVTFVDTFNPAIRGTERVDIDGSIQVPEAGSVFVAGLTRSQIESLLTRKLSPYWEEVDIKVSIQTGPSKQYFVIGEVLVPGPKIFRGDETIFEVLLKAQPEEHTANLGRVKLIRADPRDPLIITLNATDIYRYGDSTFNVHVQENDIIYVPPTFMKQVSDFAAALLVPFTELLRSVFGILLDFARYDSIRNNNQLYF
jgi:protein involved in polysaccharide export with SLBB domain